MVGNEESFWDIKMTLKTMLYITTNIQLLLKDIVMQIGLQGQLKQNPQVDTFLLLVEEQYLGNHPNKHV